VDKIDEKWSKWIKIGDRRECLDLESTEQCLFVEGKVLKWKKDDDPLSLDLIRFGPGLPDFS
jgi:hypothetical protein